MASLDYSLLELNVEEQLFLGVVQGSLVDYEDLLSELEDVDVRGWRQQTLLHVAVKLGKVEWVRRLLEMGADPGLGDGGNSSVVDVAITKNSKYPEDASRLTILNLVKEVIDKKCTSPNNAMTNDLEQEEGNESFSKEKSFLKENDKTESKEVTTLLGQMSSLNEVMNDIKGGLTSKESVLEKLEIEETPLVEECRHLKIFVLEVNEKVRQVEKKAKELNKSMTEILQIVTLKTDESKRSICIEALMQKTEILKCDDSKVSQVRELYEKLYSTITMTSCLLAFLQFQDEVRIMIDCDSNIIENMKSKFMGHDGVEVQGSRFTAFADFGERKVYFGAKKTREDHFEYYIGDLAMSLAQMCIFLAFMNGGVPYRKDDELHEQLYKKIVEEEEVKKRNTYGERENTSGKTSWSGMEWGLYATFTNKTPIAREIYLISVVPGIIAEYGMAEGRKKLSELSSLSNYYKNHIVPTLLYKSEF